MEAVKRFAEALRDPGSYIKDLKANKSSRAVGYCCTYTPEEIIHAAGALPVRLFGSKQGISKADAHFQAYSCSLVRGIMEDALNGNLDYLDGMVFPHTCDSIQRLSDIWRLNIFSAWHNDVVLPVKLDTASAKEYMEDVLAKFRTELGTWLGSEISDGALLDSISLYNRLRTGLKRLYEIRSKNPKAISGHHLNIIVKGSMTIDRAEAVELIEELISSLEKLPAESDGSKARVVLSGGICDHPEVYDLIEKAGGVVVWDDLCSGARFFEGLIDVGSSSPINAIAKRYTERVVCPAKHSSLWARGENLIEMVRKNNAKGVIFLLLKFCDPHSFDYPFMKEMLDGINIPSMLLEVEQELPSSGQLATRFEAFMGML